MTPAILSSATAPANTKATPAAQPQSTVIAIQTASTAAMIAPRLHTALASVSPARALRQSNCTHPGVSKSDRMRQNRDLQAGPTLRTPQARAGDTDPEWRNWGRGRNWETSTAVELVAVIDRRYRTLAERAGRLLIGVSAGGYGATLIANHHPGSFSVIASWSGYFQATNPAGTAALDLGTRDANQWANFAKQIPVLKKRFARWFDKTYYGFYVGSDDKRFIQTNEQIYREFPQIQGPLRVLQDL
jgi:pimeloyl-ACP methyl ester carboxylesterase